MTKTWRVYVLFTDKTWASFTVKGQDIDKASTNAAKRIQESSDGTSVETWLIDGMENEG